MSDKANDPQVVRYRRVYGPWRVATIVGILLAVAAGTAAWYSIRPTYLATAWLNINPQPEYVAFPAVHKDDNQYVQTQIEWIKSPIVLERAIGDAKIAELAEIQAAEKPVDWVAARLDVRPFNDTNTYTIEFRCADADAAAKITNAVLDAYLNVQSDVANHQTQRIIELLEQERERRRQMVERQRKNVRVLTRQRSGSRPVIVDRLTQEPVSLAPALPKLMERLATSELDRAVDEARLAAKEEEIAGQEMAVTDEEIEQALDRDREVVQLRKTVLDLQFEVDKLRSIKDEESEPSKLTALEAPIKQSEEQLKLFEARLADRSEDLRQQVSERLKRDKLGDSQADIKKLRARISDAHFLEGVLADQIRREKERLETEGNQSFDLEFAQADLNRANAIYSKIADRLEQLKTELQAPHRVTPLRRASVPAAPLPAINGRRILGASLAAFAFPFVVLLAWRLFVPPRTPVLKENETSE